MPINVAKNAGIIFSGVGNIISLYNAPIDTSIDNKNLYFFNLDGRKYCQISPESLKSYRCLHYNVFTDVNYVEHKNHIVIYKNFTDSSFSPLFQATNISASQQDGSYIVTFWSALKPGQTTKTQQSKVKFQPHLLGKSWKQGSTDYVYYYDPNKILKLKQTQLEDYQLQDQYNNIFCSIYLSFQTFLISDTDDVSKSEEQQVLIANMPPKILFQQKDNAPVLDFAGIGSGGSGMRQHQHIPYVDGSGYAFAVFHPGTGMPQLSWK